MNDSEQVCGNGAMKGFVWDSVQGLRDIAGYGHHMNAPNTSSVSHRLVVGQDDRTPVRIVGGHPGQPGAMFLNLAGTHHYLDGTLGIFDGDQQFTFMLPIPPAVHGLELDVAAGALDPQLGIRRSQALPIRLWPRVGPRQLAAADFARLLAAAARVA